MEIEKLPGRVFLDTNIVNFILDYGEYIFDGLSASETLGHRTLESIDAFYNIFLTGKRASWQLAISPMTYREITKTIDARRNNYLKTWFLDIWDYWTKTVDENDDLPSFLEAEKSKIDLLTTGILDFLPDIEDRMLICDSIAYRCDLFCTKDWKTILRYRENLGSLPIKIVSPKEWWNIIKPFAALWV